MQMNSILKRCLNDYLKMIRQILYKCSHLKHMPWLFVKKKINVIFNKTHFPDFRGPHRSGLLFVKDNNCWYHSLVESSLPERWPCTIIQRVTPIIRFFIQLSNFCRIANELHLRVIFSTRLSVPFWNYICRFS